MEVMHFSTQEERLRYLRGGFEEIKPQEAVEPKNEKNASEELTASSDAISEEKPKKAKKGKKDDKVQAE